MYGPQTTPLVETMPGDRHRFEACGARSRDPYLDRHARQGRGPHNALRAADFYGPGVGNSYLGDTSIGKLAQGKPAVFVGSPDVLHDYAYVPDIARAVTTLLAGTPIPLSVRPGMFPPRRRAPRGTSLQSRLRRSG